MKENTNLFLNNLFWFFEQCDILRRTDQDIADEFGCSRSYVRKFRIHHGIEFVH